MLSQRYIRWDEGVVTVKLDLGNMAEGQEAGLAFFNGGKDYTFLAARRNSRSFSIIYDTTGEQPETIGEISLRRTTLWIKATLDFDGRGRIAWSVDGKKYTDIDRSFQLKWGSYRGARIGLFTFNNSAEGGYADFDFITYTSRVIENPGKTR